jgi:hypothetical protein
MVSMPVSIRLHRSFAAGAVIALNLALVACGTSQSSVAKPTLAPGPTLTPAPYVPGPMSVAILPSTGPHNITGKQTLVTFHLKVRGLHLDPKHIGGAPVAKHGHVQIYLDSIPATAYSRMDMTNIFAVAAGDDFSVGVTSAWVKKHSGSHTLLIALAQNNDVLYKATPGRFSITVT